MNKKMKHRLSFDHLWTRLAVAWEPLLPALVFVASCAPAVAQVPPKQVSTTRAVAGTPADASEPHLNPDGKVRTCTACDNHGVYAGTGLISDHEPPRGAMGFFFGSSPETVKRACSDIGGLWDAAGWLPANVHACNAVIPALGVRGDVNFDFLADRMIAISVRWEPSKTEVIKELNRVGEVLWETYGTPGAINSAVPEECTDLVACIEEGRLNLGMEWQFKGQYSIGLGVTAPNRKPALHLTYFTPDKINAFKANGL